MSRHINDVYSKINIVKKKLMKFSNIEVDEHKILSLQFDIYVNELYTYIQDDFIRVKTDIRNQYSQEHIDKYIEQLNHIYDYVKVQCSSEEINNKDYISFVSEHLTKILEQYFEHNVYNFNEDYYYILFENYNGLKTWLKTYIRNYAIIIAHYIIEKSELKKHNKITLT